MARNPTELTEIAWELIEESLTSGTMTLLNQPGKSIPLGPQDILHIAQWLATSKIKKPDLVNSAEDFNLKESTGADADGKIDTKS